MIFVKLQESYENTRKQDGDDCHAYEARDKHLGHDLGGDVVSLAALFGVDLIASVVISILIGKPEKALRTIA